MQHRRIDSILSSYVQETDPFEQERLLEEIISVQAKPVVRRVLRQQLGFTVSSRGREANNIEADDLSHEIVARLIERLHNLRRVDHQRDDAVITDFLSYVNRVARNVCYDHLRYKYPVRYLLKNRIRYVLSRHPCFRLWKEDQSTTMCGLLEWQSAKTCHDLLDDDQIVDQVKSKYRITQGRPIQLLVQVLNGIFTETGTPVVIDRLVTLVSRIIETNELVFDSLDRELESIQLSVPDQRPLADKNIEDRERLKELWSHILKLPVLQRKVVLLSTIDGVREDMWSIFLESGTINRSNIIEALDIQDEDFLHLWPWIPLDSSTLANYLGITRDQVVRAKYYARKSLRKSLIKTNGSGK
jgi:RNA polymerase sigma factor (sigma-70 family)